MIWRLPKAFQSRRKKKQDKELYMDMKLMEIRLNALLNILDVKRND